MNILVAGVRDYIHVVGHRPGDIATVYVDPSKGKKSFTGRRRKFWRICAGTHGTDSAKIPTVTQSKYKSRAHCKLDAMRLEAIYEF